MQKIDLYYDHYKETLTLCKEAQQKRNKNFIYLCILEAFSFLLLIRPETVFEFFINSINSELNVSLSFSNAVLQTLLWVITTFILIQYCQNVLYVERQYLYINKLEKEISSCMDGSPFSRESDSYLGKYPLVLNFIDLFYKMLMPVMCFIINLIHISKECRIAEKLTCALICDIVLWGATSVIIWFYFFEIHSKITKWCKNHMPFVDKISDMLRKLLKEV